MQQEVVAEAPTQTVKMVAKDAIQRSGAHIMWDQVTAWLHVADAADPVTEQLTVYVLAAVVAQAATFVFKAETAIKMVVARTQLQNVQILTATHL